MRKQCLLIVATCICTIVALLYGFRFIYVKDITSMLISTVLIFLMCIMYSYCVKKTTFSEGYTLVQALLFYRCCLKNNVKASDINDGNLEMLLRIAKEKNITSNMDKTILLSMYHRGEEADMFIRRQKAPNDMRNKNKGRFGR